MIFKIAIVDDDGADAAKKYYERLGIKFFPTRYQPLTMVVYIT